LTGEVPIVLNVSDCEPAERD